MRSWAARITIIYALLYLVGLCWGCQFPIDDTFIVNSPVLIDLIHMKGYKEVERKTSDSTLKNGELHTTHDTLTTHDARHTEDVERWRYETVRTKHQLLSR